MISTDSEDALIWSAGHLPPVRWSDGATLVAVSPIPPLGHLRGEQPTATTTPLPDGESLLFSPTDSSSDGGATPRGLDRLCAALGRAAGHSTTSSIQSSSRSAGRYGGGGRSAAPVSQRGRTAVTSLVSARMAAELLVDELDLIFSASSERSTPTPLRRLRSGLPIFRPHGTRH